MSKSSVHTRLGSDNNWFLRTNKWLLILAVPLAACHAGNSGSTTIVGEEPQLEASEPEPSPPNVAYAAALCRAIQESNEVPIACSVQNLDNTVAMLIAFRNAEEMAVLVEPVVQELAAPFCNATNASNRRGTIVFAVLAQSAQMYDCETGTLHDVVES